MESYLEFERFILSCVTRAKEQNEKMYNTLNILLITGCRINEIEFINWTIKETKVLLHCSKQNKYREFEQNIFPVQFIDYIISGDEKDFIINKSSFYYYWNSIISGSCLINGDIEHSAHLFRYYFIKQLYYIQKKQPEEIQSILVHETTEVTRKYIFANTTITNN